MAIDTLVAGVLRVASAVPDPPFELIENGALVGFDIALTQAICADLGLRWQACRFPGGNFNDIFKGLADGSWDCVASGTTITAPRQAIADFCSPYLQSGQSLVCNVSRTPDLRSVDDLGGRIIAVQHGNTSEPVVQALKARGAVADVRIYPYDGITQMLDDLQAGSIDAIMKLAPVMRWLTRDRPDLAVVQDQITDERLGICVRRGNTSLHAALDDAQARLAANGTLARLTETWIRS